MLETHCTSKTYFCLTVPQKVTIYHRTQKFPSLVTYLEEWKTGTQTCACTHVSVKPSLQRPNVETTQMFASGRMDHPIWDSHSVQYCLALRKNEVLIDAKMWMNLKKDCAKWMKPDTRGDLL